MHKKKKRLTSAVSRSKVAPLTHKLRDDSVKAGALVPKTRLARAQLSEVLCAPREGKKLKEDRKRVFVYNAKQRRRGMENLCSLFAGGCT